MPPPNTPQEGVTAPGSRPASPPNVFRQHSPHPSSADANASRDVSSMLELDYQSLEYIEPIDDTLLCSVCRTPFHAPITTPCGHTFCAGCINRALEMQPTCPIDRLPINKTQDYRRLPLIIKDQLDRLRVRCPNTGCDYECPREHIGGHYERRCEFTPIRCPEPSCTKLTARRDALPEKGCLHGEIACEFCGKAVALAEFDAHCDHSCDGVRSTCPECKANVVRHRLGKHKSQDCPEGQTRCRWYTAGCKVTDKRRIIREHERDGCIFEAISRLLDQRSEDRKIIDQLTGRLANLEARHKRRENRERREQRTDSVLASGAAVPGLPDAGTVAAPNLELNNSVPLFSSAATDNGAWASPEDYMLAQFERMETQMEDLRAKMMEMDAYQSLSLLQQTARVNEQLTELGSKVGVLNMHTTWLMNMQRQSHTQQRAGSAVGPSGPGMSHSGESTGTRSGSLEDGGRYPGGSRRNSDGRGEHPPRL